MRTSATSGRWVSRSITNVYRPGDLRVTAFSLAGPRDRVDKIVKRLRLMP